MRIIVLYQSLSNNSEARGSASELECIWRYFRYLGITLDDHFSFNQHILGIHKGCQQRLTVLRKLKQLSVQPHLILLLYRSIIEPVLMYGAISFFFFICLQPLIGTNF